MRGSARMARAMETRWRLAAGELDAALADDGVVFLLERFGEFVDACDAAGGEDVLFGGVGTGERDVFANRAVEEKCILQDDAELRAIGVQAHGAKDRCRRPARGRWIGT